MTTKNSKGKGVALAAFALGWALLASCGKPPAATGGAAPQAYGQRAGQSGQNPGAGQGGQRQGGGQGSYGPGGGQAYSGGRRAAIIPVQAMTAKSDTLVASRSTAGVVSPVMQSQIATQVAGVVKRVLRNAGDWVKAGDPIVELEDAQLKISLSTARIALQNAQINLASGQVNSDQAGPKLSLQVQAAQAAYDSAVKYYQSQKALFDLGGITAAQLDTASSQQSTAQANLEAAKSALSQNASSGDQAILQLKLAVEQAQNQVDQATLNLQNASVRAPFAGQIAAVNLQPGMYAGSNTAVLTLVSSDRKITFNVSPADAPFLGAGTALSFAVSGKSYAIRVSQVPSAPISGVVPMSASLSGPQLPFGTVGTVQYAVPLARGILVPIAALSTLEDQNYVFVVDSSRAAVKNVSIIAESGTMAAVDGLAEGDVVIVNPPPGLLQGSQVQPTMMAAPNASASPAATPRAGAPGSQAGAPRAGGNFPSGAPAAAPGGGGNRQGGQAGQTGQGGQNWQGRQGGQGQQGGQGGQNWQGGQNGQGGRSGRPRPQASASPAPEAGTP